MRRIHFSVSLALTCALLLSALPARSAARLFTPPDAMAATGRGFLYSYRTLHDVKITGGIGKLDFTIHKEAEASAGTWNSVTPGTTTDLEDAGDDAEGRVRFYYSALHTSPPAVTGNYAPVPTVMRLMKFEALHNQGRMSDFRRTSNQTIATATATDIDRTLQGATGAHLSHSTSSNARTVAILLPGHYKIRLNVALVTTSGGTAADNGTGFRQCRITWSGDGYATSSLIDVGSGSAISSQLTTCKASKSIYLGRGAQVRAYVHHSAGVNLDVPGGSSNNHSPSLTITRQ